MNAAPDKAEGDKSKTPSVSRREALKKQGIDDPDMPPCDAMHLAGYLFEIGPMMGDSPITHGEIESWQRNTGITLNAWEARTLKRLSIEYMSEAHKARARDCPAPWGGAPVPNLNAERVRDSLRALAAL